MSTYHNIYEENIQKENANLLIDKRQNDSFLLINFFNTVISSFTWQNLPKTILKRMPEEQLCFSGRTAFFIDDNGEYKIYPCFMSGALLENGEYESYQIIARNGKTWQRKREDIEICYNNSLCVPSAPSIFTLADQASYALRAVRSSLRRSMLPKVITGNTNEALSALSDMLDDELNLKPFRVAFNSAISKNENEVIDFFDNSKEDVLAKWDVFVRYRNLFYTTFGINNIEIMKKERLTESEGSGNDEITRYTLLNDMISCRQDFCDRVKERFNYDLSFEVNRDSMTVYETQLDNDEKIDNIEIDLQKGVNYADGQQEKKEDKTDE